VSRPWVDRTLMLDTNVLIYLARWDATGRWINQTFLVPRGDAPLVSVVSVAEARQFANAHQWPLEKNERLRKVIDRCVVTDITAPERTLLDAYSTLDCESRAMRPSPRRMGKNDLWIAAEAARQGAVLLTSDEDFEHLHRSGHLVVDRYARIATT